MRPAALSQPNPNQCHLVNPMLYIGIFEPNYSNTMPNTAYLSDSDTDLWSPTNEQAAYSNNSYPAAHQQIYPNASYDQGVNQDFSSSPSLLETLLRHGKDGVAQDYVNPDGKQEAVAGGVQNMPNISCQSTPYTPTSSTDRVSPIVAFVPNTPEQVQVQLPQIQDGYFQSYQDYPIQQHPTSCVTPSRMMVPNSPTNYGAQHSYAAYVNSFNVKRSPNETKEFAEEHAHKQVDYPWMKSYSNGL
jgi:hypothetical protein